ncbi:MAG TPA: hypothetical protein VGD39_06895 [Nocardioides sp.]
MSTPDMIDTRDIEERLRAALTARADLVQPEDLAPLAPVVELKPRWQSPWVLLATAAVVLLVLGVVLQGVGGRQRSDDVAPKPDEPQVVLPDDVGRDWKADDSSTPARLDLDGDGRKETVRFLAEETKHFVGRIRLQTTLSSTGEEAYGIAQLSSTLGVYARDPIDADADGDQELVLPFESMGDGPEAPAHPLVFDLHDGLLVQVAVQDPELLQLGNVPVPGSRTDYYEMVRSHSYWSEDGRLLSSRSVSAFASGGMTTARPSELVLDSWEWVLGDDEVLRPEPRGCFVETARGDLEQCGAGARDSLPAIDTASGSTFGPGEEAAYVGGFPEFDASLVPGTPPVLDVRLRGQGGIELSRALDLPDPRVDRQQPTGVFYDGVSLLVSSASDPSQMQVLIAPGDELFPVDVVGEVPLGAGTTADGRDYRSWVTGDGSGRLVTVVQGEGDTWQAWTWMMVSPRKMTALPLGEVCFDDVADPSTLRGC